MRSLFTLVLLTLVVAVRASHDHKFIMGTPWYSEFLEEEDVMVEGSKFKSKRRKGNEGKMKEVSTKKKPMEKKDDNKKPGWFGNLKFEDLTDSLE